MSEIILAFFSSLGIVLLAIRILDYFFYRHRRIKGSLFVDIRGKEEREIVDTLDLIVTIQGTAAGNAALGSIVFITDAKTKLSNIELMDYFNLYRLNVHIVSEHEFDGISLL